MERKRSVKRQQQQQQQEEHRHRRPFAKKCKDLCRQFIAFMFSNVGIIGLVVGYTMAGAFLFRYVEQGFELDEVVSEVFASRNRTIERLWNMTLDVNSFLEDDEEYRRQISAELSQFQEKMVELVIKGYDGSDKKYSERWTFVGAFLYSLTVITTIGYGNITPHTDEGKITTIVYAIVGMPLFLLYLSNIGDIMARSFKWIYANCCLCRWCPGVAKRRNERQKKRMEEMDMEEEEDDEDEDDEGGKKNSVSEHTEEDDGSEYDVETVTVPVTVCLAIMVGYICGGAIWFAKWEEWEFLDASYFCFISLSTIGFGDLVPGKNSYAGPRRDDPSGTGAKREDVISEVLEFSFIFCAMYLMLGMALIAMCFNLMQEEVIHKIRTTVRTVKYVLRCR